MFEKKTKSAFDFRGPKNKTFGNDSDESDEQVEEVPDVQDFMKSMDGAINRAKQDEKNATIAGVYSTVKNAMGAVKKSFNACGCFSKK